MENIPQKVTVPGYFEACNIVISFYYLPHLCFMYTIIVIISPLFGHHHRNDGNVKGVSDSGGLRIRKFRQEDYHDDDSEEDGTYNGNSTQQQ